MPFIAIRKATGERIDITAIEYPRAALTSGECLCQLCGVPMIVKAGLVHQHHFAHAGRCTSDYQSHPESPAHREAKRYLDTHLREWFKEYANTHNAYEVPIPEVKRIADLLVTFPTGWRVAHEVQLASITTEHLQERTSQEPLPCNGKGLRKG
jgi:competence CoiA-like predicted nuclease